MMGLIFILFFTTLYGLSMAGGKCGRYFFISGFLLNTGHIIYRWSFLGRLPVTERYDILLVMAAMTAGSYFYFQRKLPTSLLFSVLPLIVVLFCFFALFQEKLDTIEPNMNSLWFYLYMMLFASGYALMTAGSAAGMIHLLGKNSSHEVIQYRLTLFGWLLFSFSLIAGSIWFFRVHGVYWLWTAKELWTTVAWFYYSFYFHARMVNTFSARSASLLGAAGLGVLLFSYLGVTPLLGSPWTQF